jgi:hypothetical protein
MRIIYFIFIVFLINLFPVYNQTKKDTSNPKEVKLGRSSENDTSFVALDSLNIDSTAFKAKVKNLKKRELDVFIDEDGDGINDHRKMGTGLNNCHQKRKRKGK